MNTKPIPVRGSGSPRLPGSFPRVRGKRQVRHQGIIVARLIPACAGKTRRLWAWRPPSPAHPRACGENVLAASSASSTPGSSPRVRGKPIEQQFLRARVGLIPARAGKTPSTTSPKKARPAHPRACGENIKTTAPPAIEAGSSPRVRGKHPRRPRTGRGRGLIPARAGKTTRRPRGRGCPWAHPHACGENLSRSSLTFVSWGSSPRVRGKRLRLLAQTRTRRLIPARAGKTAMRTGAGADTGAHPRACGENWEGWGTALKPAGSSPRVRGKPTCVS